MFTKRIPVKERFEKYVSKPEHTECWLWTGTINASGYGTFRLPGREGKNMMTHRLAYLWANNDLPDDLCVCHRCDVRNCVNPAHLFLGTNLDNIRDRDAKGRGRGRSYPGEQSPNSKLTNEKVLAIRADPRRHNKIAADYGLARSTVSQIKSRFNWRHI